jgi:hypothetical protein
MQTRLQIFNTLAITTQLHSTETWMLREKQIQNHSRRDEIFFEKQQNTYSLTTNEIIILWKDLTRN